MAEPESFEASERWRVIDRGLGRTLYSSETEAASIAYIEKLDPHDVIARLNLTLVPPGRRYGVKIK